MTSVQKPLNSVVFFDIDNTILEGPFESIVFPTVFNEMSARSGLSTDVIRKLVVEENFAQQRDPNIPAIQAMDWDALVQRVAHTLGIHLAKGIILDLVMSHRESPFLIMLDDAREVLLSLAKSNRRIVAATKGLRKYQIPLLEAVNLLPVFEEVLTPDCYGVLKNDIRFYGDWPQITETQLSVGDHWQDDVVAPKSFGFKSVWRLSSTNAPNALNALRHLMPLQRPQVFKHPIESTVRPDAIIFNLHELSDVLVKLEHQEYAVPSQ